MPLFSVGTCPLVLFHPVLFLLSFPSHFLPPSAFLALFSILFLFFINLFLFFFAFRVYLFHSFSLSPSSLSLLTLLWVVQPSSLSCFLSLFSVLSSLASLFSTFPFLFFSNSSNVFRQASSLRIRPFSGLTIPTFSLSFSLFLFTYLFFILLLWSLSLASHSLNINMFQHSGFYHRYLYCYLMNSFFNSRVRTKYFGNELNIKSMLTRRDPVTPSLGLFNYVAWLQIKNILTPHGSAISDNSAES